MTTGKQILEARKTISYAKNMKADITADRVHQPSPMICHALAMGHEDDVLLAALVLLFCG